MKIAILHFILIFPLIFSNAWATGWNDYELDIGGGYSIVKTNSLNVCLATNDGAILLFPQDYESVGPIVGYYSGDSVILTRNTGMKRRHLFEGDAFEEIDNSTEYFFIYTKEGSSLLGPFQKVEFQKKIKQLGIEHFDWVVPKNPNFLKPLIGSLFFLSLAIPILVIKHFYISVPTIAIIILTIRSYLKKRKHKRSLR